MRLRRDYTWSGSSWAFSTEVRYVYDGMLIVQERSSGNHPQVTYTRGTDLSGTLEGAGGIGGLLSRGAHAISSPYQLSSAAHYHADGNGNVTMLVGTGSPTIKAYYKYDPFGRTIGSAGSLVGVNAMRFSSKPVMGSSELYYYGYQFYDPSSQRWLNRDPISELGHRVLSGKFSALRPSLRQMIDPYSGFRNSPLLLIDTDGRGVAGPAGGDCVNNSSYPEWMLMGDRTWKLLLPGQSSRWYEDCEGMTCSGFFYHVSNREDGECDKTGSPVMTNCNRGSPPFSWRGWRPYDKQHTFAIPPGDGPVTPPLKLNWPQRGAIVDVPPLSLYVWPLSTPYRGPYAQR
jgi:RHS repeat-associated protein